MKKSSVIGMILNLITGVLILGFLVFLCGVGLAFNEGIYLIDIPHKTYVAIWFAFCILAYILIVYWMYYTSLRAEYDDFLESHSESHNNDSNNIAD